MWIPNDIQQKRWSPNVCAHKRTNRKTWKWEKGMDFHPKQIVTVNGGESSMLLMGEQYPCDVTQCWPVVCLSFGVHCVHAECILQSIHIAPGAIPPIEPNTHSSIRCNIILYGFRFVYYLLFMCWSYLGFSSLLYSPAIGYRIFTLISSHSFCWASIRCGVPCNVCSGLFDPIPHQMANARLISTFEILMMLLLVGQFKI